MLVAFYSQKRYNITKRMFCSELTVFLMCEKLPSLKLGMNMRYTCRICNKQEYLYLALKNNYCRIGGLYYIKPRRSKTTGREIFP
jgi:hypothetical protein